MKQPGTQESGKKFRHGTKFVGGRVWKWRKCLRFNTWGRGTELGVAHRMNRASAPRRRNGFTLTELMIVVLIAGLVLAVVGPRFVNYIRYLGARSGVSQVVADLSLARTLAVREAQTVSLTVLDSRRYRIAVEAGDARTIKTTDIGGSQGSVTFVSPVDTRVAFDSRGMLRTGSATAIIVAHGGAADTVSITGVGRVYRGSGN